MTSLATLGLALSILQAGPDRPELVDVRKISDRANHSAFTDLVRFRDRWFLCFREGAGHVSPDGALRVLTSPDGDEWTSAALLTSKTGDLRDPKLSITPDGRLMLAGVSALHQPSPVRHQSMVWFSDDGRSWSEGKPIGEPDVWLWRPAWHEGVAYGVGYSTTGAHFTRLYSSRDGVDFATIVPTLFDRGYSNESALAFLPDGSALCLMRRDGKGADGTDQLGRSKPPYTEWTWKDLGRHFGGPALLRLPDGRLVAGGRSHEGKVHTSLAWLDPDAGTLTEFLTLPSGGDTSYPGLVWHDGMLWVSYYSSHEGKTSVYLARVKLPSK
jgi:hypothetical protein